MSWSSLTTIVTWPQSIKEMYIRGAPAIGAAAAFGLALAATQSQANTPEGLLADLEDGR